MGLCSGTIWLVVRAGGGAYNSLVSAIHRRIRILISSYFSFFAVHFNPRLLVPRPPIAQLLLLPFLQVLCILFVVFVFTIPRTTLSPRGLLKLRTR